MTERLDDPLSESPPPASPPIAGFALGAQYAIAAILVELAAAGVADPERVFVLTALVGEGFARAPGIDGAAAASMLAGVEGAYRQLAAIVLSAQAEPAQG